MPRHPQYQHRFASIPQAYLDFVKGLTVSGELTEQQADSLVALFAEAPVSGIFPKEDSRIARLDNELGYAFMGRFGIAGIYGFLFAWKSSWTAAALHNFSYGARNAIRADWNDFLAESGEDVGHESILACSEPLPTGKHFYYGWKTPVEAARMYREERDNS